MAWLDWLLGGSNPRDGIRGNPIVQRCEPGADARSKLDKLAGVPWPVDVWCDSCGRGGFGTPCKCDPQLGRPAKWFET